MTLFSELWLLSPSTRLSSHILFLLLNKKMSSWIDPTIPDISIRLPTLDLVVGMVSSDNLMSVVGRLMRQLRNSPSAPANDFHDGPAPAIEPAADSDDESPEAAIKSGKGGSQETLLPDDYKVNVINRILSMCSSNNYGNLWTSIGISTY